MVEGGDRPGLTLEAGETAGIRCGGGGQDLQCDAAVEVRVLGDEHFTHPALAQALDEKLDLARWACEELLKIDDLEVVTEPQLSIVTFRLRPEGLEEAELTELMTTTWLRMPTRPSGRP